MPLPVTLAADAVAAARDEELRRIRSSSSVRATSPKSIARIPRLKDALAGVLVESVAARGWAALGRLNGGDLILAIDGRPVKNVVDFETRMKDIARAQARVGRLRSQARHPDDVHRDSAGVEIDGQEIADAHSTRGVLLVGWSARRALRARGQTADERAAARDVVKKRGDAVVMVLATIKMRVNIGGREQPIEQPAQANATVLDATGLAVMSLSTLAARRRDVAVSSAQRVRRRHARGSHERAVRHPHASRRRSRGAGASSCCKDQDLDLAFVRPVEPPATPMTFVDAPSGKAVAARSRCSSCSARREATGWTDRGARSAACSSSSTSRGRTTWSPCLGRRRRARIAALRHVRPFRRRHRDAQSPGSRGAAPLTGVLPADDIREVAKQAPTTTNKVTS